MALSPLPSLGRRGGKAAAPRACECGCGGRTRGGRFVPGHDSRRLGWAVRLWLGTDVTGITAGERKAATEATPELRKMFPTRFPDKAKTDAA